MPEYRRSCVEGGTYFFTVVTFERKPILVSDSARMILHQAWMEVTKRFPFETVAVCLLPDHLHCIWRLPEGDADYSTRWKEIKRRFSKEYLLQVGPVGQRNASRQRKHEVDIWQRRFWEHTIEDEEDLEVHLDYIYYNPIKHRLVERTTDWPYSSFARFVKEGIYDADWFGWDEGRLQGVGWE